MSDDVSLLGDIADLPSAQALREHLGALRAAFETGLAGANPFPSGDSLDETTHQLSEQEKAVVELVGTALDALDDIAAGKTESLAGLQQVLGSIDDTIDEIFSNGSSTTVNHHA